MDVVDVKSFPKELQGVIRVLLSTQLNNEQGVDLSVGDLANYFFATNPRDRAFYQDVFEQLDKLEASEDSVSKLIDSMQTAKLLREVSIDAYDVSEGKGSLDALLLKLAKLSQAPQSSDDGLGDISFVSDDLHELVNKSIKARGLRWRLNTLNRMLGSLRRGDFGFIFARPETGKTTFLASEVTYMATQLTEEQGPILWLNNEEQGDKVMLRCYQAALGLDLTQLFRDLDGNKARYHELTHGKIKQHDSGTIHKRTVEKLCRTLRPSLIIFDQIDKIQGFDSDREDLRLGTIYQWARELAKEFAPVIGVCQADGSGEGQKWLTMANVANAKTAKQAEADWIVGIGKVNEVGYDQLRYLHASKNKLMGDEDSIPDLRHGRCEVLIHADVARYGDIQT